MPKLERRTTISRRQALIILAGGMTSRTISQPAAGQGLFNVLWSNHPMGDGKGEGTARPCANMLDAASLKDPRNIIYGDNQCAVRFGTCLRRSFPELRYSDFPALTRGDDSGVKTPLMTCRILTKDSCAHSNEDLHFLRTAELASMLMLVSLDSNRKDFPSFTFLGPTEIFDRPLEGVNDFRNSLVDRRGIIYVENFWITDDGDPGCHIDLWDGSIKRTKNELYYRGRDGGVDLRFDKDAERILFWEIRG